MRLVSLRVVTFSAAGRLGRVAYAMLPFPVRGLSLAPGISVVHETRAGTLLRVTALRA